MKLLNAIIMKIKMKEGRLKKPVKKQKQQNRQWSITGDICPDCGNHLRIDLNCMGISCSFVKCINYEK